MSVTDRQASDEINAMLLTAWNAGALAAIENDTLGELEWKGKVKVQKSGGFWARVSQQIVSQPQKSLADETTFGANKKRYETIGVVTVQVFAPIEVRNGYRKGDGLASLIRDAFREVGQGGEVWYRNSRKVALVDDGKEHRWNVIAEFSYDTIA